jgi:hypothetical protein
MLVARPRLDSPLGAATLTYDAASEMYFANPQTVPTSLIAYRPNLSKFTVFNHRTHARVFDYSVALAGPRSSSVAQRGSIGLKANAGADRAVAIIPNGRGLVYRITVTIDRLLQTIDVTGRS